MSKTTTDVKSKQKQYQCTSCKDTECTQIAKQCLNCEYSNSRPTWETRCINCKRIKMMTSNEFKFCEKQAIKIASDALDRMYKGYMYKDNMDTSTAKIPYILRAMSFVSDHHRMHIMIKINDRARCAALQQLGYNIRGRIVTIGKDIRDIDEIVDTFYNTFPFMVGVPTGVP